MICIACLDLYTHDAVLLEIAELWEPSSYCIQELCMYRVMHWHTYLSLMSQLIPLAMENYAWVLEERPNLFCPVWLLNRSLSLLPRCARFSFRITACRLNFTLWPEPCWQNVHLGLLDRSYKHNMVCCCY